MAKKETQKTIRIACEGAATVQLDALTPMQGGLKFLPEESYKKLKDSIVGLGFSFPVQAWKDKKKVYILDAHQRVLTLKRMRDEEDYKIPPLPVSWVSASSKKEAAKKLLAAASQYGEVNYEGLFGFIKEFDIDVTQMSADFKFPEIDMNRFQQTFFPVEKEVSFKVKEKVGDEEETESTVKACPKCGYEFHD